MATFSSVTSAHLLQAIAEHDDRGADDFLALYGFTPAPEYTLRHEGRTYDARAVLGVAHKHATGRLATAEEFGSSTDAALAILRKRGFDVSEPVTARRAPAARAIAGRSTTARVTRTPTSSRSTAQREAAEKLCPTCSMTLPGTGVCDYCS